MTDKDLNKIKVQVLSGPRAKKPITLWEFLQGSTCGSADPAKPGGQGDNATAGCVGVGGTLTELVLKCLHQCLIAGAKIVLPPNANYSLKGGNYSTDQKGRLGKAKFTISKKSPGDRDSKITAAIGALGVAGDVGFHLLGDQFGGSTYYPNVVPANGKSFTEEQAAASGTTPGKSLNLSGYKTLEGLWAKALQKGPLRVTVSLGYTDNDRRPALFLIDFSLGGAIFSFQLENQPGQTLNAKQLDSLRAKVE